MTAPPDSSCLTQKSGSQPTLHVDEFSTSLSGGVGNANSKYLGYAYGSVSASCETFEGASATILAQSCVVPVEDGQVSAWVGLQNKTAHLVNLTSRWAQAGFVKQSGLDLATYFEYCPESDMMVDGLPDKYSGILIQQRPAFAGSTYTCSVERDENDEVKLVASPIEETPFPWSELLQHGGLITASWTGEVSNDDTEGMPGTNVTNGRCKFSAIKYRKPDSSSWHVPAFLYDATPETANGGKRKVGNDGFEIWRE